ncbi:MAG: penicillin-binding protein beta-lactamase class [Chthoniobacteraceae bacterium]|nr:penicillin-binding protein beta-lactamase class [Chthoniobacteraceae bacterium]
MRLISAAAAALIAFGASAHAAPDDVSHQIERIREDHDIPALAVAVVDEGELVAIGATGFRNSRVQVPVTLSDKWHLGSCTKSMTASVVAMLVEEGKLRWNSTIAEIFPDLGDEIETAWQGVTLEQLLVHRGGAPGEPPAGIWKAALLQRGTPTEQRWAFVKGLLAREPAAPPNSRWIYSDCGYAIVGAMMERVTGESWEALLKNRLFEPLGLTSAGFGPPSAPGQLDQPWGHRGYDSPYTPVPPGPDADYPPAIAPAAAVHCTIADFVMYTNWHLAGARGECRLLTPESFKKLHTPPEEQEYAMGWAVTKRRWAGGTALMHSGENTMFYSVMWLGPKENTAFVAAANADSPEAQQACDEAIRFLINKY